MTAHARKTPGSNVASPKTADAAGFILNVDTPTGTIAVTVTRKRVRNLNLRVRGDGSVVASIPLHTSAARAQAFLDRRASWIAQHVLRHREQAELERDTAHAPSTIPLWGELVSSEKAFGSALPSESAVAEAEDLVAELYRQEVKRALPAVAEHLEHQMGVHASRWQVRAMKTRWGSCTPRTRAIRINARLAAYPPSCLEFVVAHELCHLMEPSHNQRFHTLLDIYCPENRAIASLLKKPARAAARPQA